MQSILEKLGAFFEAHVEKLVLGIVLIICGVVLMKWVVFSPNLKEYDGQRFSPTAIDEHISRAYAPEIEARLNAPPQAGDEVAMGPWNNPIDPNDPIRLGIRGALDRGFAGLLENSIPFVNAQRAVPLPLNVGTGHGGPRPDEGERRMYSLPVVGDVWEVKAGHIRAAAYVPTVALTEDVTYEQSKPEPNDVDLVTVQAEFNAASLHRRFYDSFLGDEIREEWRDEELAKPVFGAVNLQRQEKRPDGTWSDWEDVPRIAIENRRQLFAIYEEVDDLPTGGMQVRLLQLGREDVQADLLQPSGYSMASAYEEWYPPVLHREYTAAYDKMRKKELREEREAEMERRGIGRRGRDGDNTNTRSRDRNRGGGATADLGYGGAGGNTRRRGARGRGRPGQDSAGYGGEYGMGNERGGRSRGARGRTPRPSDGMMDDMYGGYGMGLMTEPTGVDKVLQKYNDILITPGKDIAEETNLLFWAHDDTVQPGKTYRYRIRIGVLNPVAGKNYLADEYLGYRNKALLWSEFSSDSEEVSIPGRAYFFAKSYREDADIMKVEVAKYLWGYWRSETFDVKPGEIIGHVVETRSEDEDRLNAMMSPEMMDGAYGMMPSMTDEITVDPEEIDYSTNAVFIGTSKSPAWTGDSRLREQVLYRMLYTEDGTTISRSPVSSINWNADLRAIQSLIAREKGRKREDFKSFKAPTKNRGMNPFGPGYGGEMMGYGL